MTPEAKSTIDAFLNRRGYSIPLSRAAGITGVSMKDLTNWRQRDLLPFPIEKIGGRYFVTRDGFIAIGIMAELAWLIGPDNASAAANAIWETLFARSPHGLDIEEFRDWVIYFRKPVASAAGISDKPRFPSKDESEWDRVMGFPLQFTTAKQLQLQPVPNSTAVMLPIGQVVCHWALGLEPELDGGMKP